MNPTTDVSSEQRPPPNRSRQRRLLQFVALPVVCLGLGVVGGIIGSNFGDDGSSTRSVVVGKRSATTVPGLTQVRPTTTFLLPTTLPRIPGATGATGPAGKDGRGVSGIQWVSTGGTFRGLMEWYATCPNGTTPVGWQFKSSNAIVTTAGEFDSPQKWWFKVTNESALSSSGSAFFKLACLSIS